MAEQLEPVLDLPPQRVMCARHMEPFRDQWPKGWAVAVVKLMNFLLKSEGFRNAVGKVFIPEVAERVLDGKPACEWVSPENILEVYQESGIGMRSLCDVCHSVSLGTPFSLKNSWGRVKRFRHLCFHCVLHRLVPDQENVK